MKIAHIYPVDNTAYMLGQPYCMFLTHLVDKYPFYGEMAKYMRMQGSYIILDNSLIECKGNTINIEKVCDTAESIGANEIILPDVFLDGPATIKSFKESMNYLTDRYGIYIPFRLMAVAQGKDSKEFAECFEYFNSQAMIDTIGIPKVCSKLHPAGRPYFEYLWQSTDKDIHLLGLWYSFTELLEYKNPHKIRSVDTCHKSFLIREGKRWDSVRPDGFTLDLDKDNLDTDILKGMRRLEWLVR